MFQGFFVLVVSGLSILPLPSVAEEEGVLIVQLSILATVGKCTQAAIEFQPEEWAALSDHVWHGEAARKLPRKDRIRLWMTARNILKQIGPETCADTRRQIQTWLPTFQPKPRG
jgi:hypothetical protein